MSRVMQPDGSYIREAGVPGSASQDILYKYFSEYKVKAEPRAAEKTEPDAATAVPAEVAEGFFGKLKSWFRSLFA